jgi:cellobiose phosphorylase
MNFGHFDDVKREYIIDTPCTPLPWLNYLGSEDFFGLISNCAGGYNFYRDAKLRRLTRYRYNNVPADNGGRRFYICDGGSVGGESVGGESVDSNAWSPAFLPAKTKLDSYRCRHGLGYTVFESEKGKLAASLTCFIPLGANAEVNRLTLTKNSEAVKTVNVCSAIEWCLWNAVDDSTNFQRNFSTGQVETTGSTL